MDNWVNCESVDLYNNNLSINFKKSGGAEWIMIKQFIILT